MSLRSINPATNQLLKKISEHSDKEIEKKIQTAQLDYDIWKKSLFANRAKHFKIIAEILLNEKDNYAKLITTEMGKPFREALKEIERCATVSNYYADNANIFLKNEIIPTEARNSYVSYEPMGIILCIMPWNFPFWQVFRFAAPAIMAGNAVLLKHASNVPQCAIAIEELFRRAQFPNGIFQTLLIDAGKASKLIKDERIKAVTLTGSEEAGSRVAELSGKFVKKIVLELGGSDPFIVLEDANLKNAAEIAVKSRLINTGQSCISAKRFIVMEGVAEAFLQMVKEQVEKLKLGDPLLNETDIGPLAKDELVKNVLKQVERTVKLGAKLIFGGQRPKMNGAYFQPTILLNVKPGMPCFDEEVFGPVFSITIAKDTDEAIELANHSRYGLASSIWTEDLEKGNLLAKKIEAGNVFINALPKSDVRLPFGGIKKSGYGRELSHLGIKEFVNIKTVWVG